MNGDRAPADIRSGLGLLLRTLRSYPRDGVVAIVGALVWMATVVLIPYVVATIVDDAILVKGSRGFAMEEVVAAIVASALGTAP